MKRIPVLFLLIAAMLLWTGCEGTRPELSSSEPEQEVYTSSIEELSQIFYEDSPTSAPDASVLTVEDGDGNDITAEVIELWANANRIYNVDDDELFDVDWSAPVLLVEDAPAYFELHNYDEIVDAVFTADGKAQLEQTTIGGPHAFIQKKDGAIYRMGPWKTGVYFGDAPVAIDVKDRSDTALTLTITYAVPIAEDSFMDGQTDFTIVKTDSGWLVDRYVYPEAQR